MSKVILDWGFWTKKDRADISQYLEANGVEYEWHYIDVSDDTWKKNIDERNERIRAGNGGPDFFVDEGLLQKLVSLFEEPDIEEIDVWYQY